MTLGGCWRGLTRNQARTEPHHPDPTLRGRTYAIPFVQVWEAALRLASGGLRGWSLAAADWNRGSITAESRTLLFRFVDDVEVRVSLDENGQTRVDVASSSRVGRGDLGQNARRVRAFFRALDREAGAGPGTILDPTLPLLRAGLLLLAVATACTPSRDAPPQTPPQSEEPSPPTRNFHGRSYERNLVFLTGQGDSTLLVPWFFTARTRAGGVDRRVRGWLARSGEWDPFMEDSWEGPPTQVPWRILPRGPTRLIVGLDDALERVVFQEGPRQLEVILGNLLAEWTGSRAQTFRIQEGATRLSDRRVEGFILDMSRAWTAEDEPPGDWGFLISGDSVQIVLEDAGPTGDPQGGSFSFWTRLDFTDRRWDRVRLEWSEQRPFEPARRDVPISWEVRHPRREVSGSLTTSAPFLEAGEGEGPVLPVDALFQVAGTLTLDGRAFPVRGLIRHVQR